MNKKELKNWKKNLKYQNSLTTVILYIDDGNDFDFITDNNLFSVLGYDCAIHMLKYFCKKFKEELKEYERSDKGYENGSEEI